MLRGASVDLVVDVRSVPRSRTNPQYNFDVIADALRPWQVSYTRIEELGGLRGRSRTIPPAMNAFWENQSFHNYADYALSEEFARGLLELMSIGAERRTTVMCAEAVWWRCHRRIIADYLLLHDREVFHLMGEDRADPARMTSGARERDGRLVYPAPVNASESQA